jgi:hypothetical protein
MKIIKWTLLAIFFITTFGILFRGFIFRHLVTYRSVGLRTNYYATYNKLVDLINANADNKSYQDIEEIIKLGLSITSKQLNFTADKNNIDPNKLVASKTAHCVGYATFFSTTCNQLLDKYKLADTWTAKPQVGQLYFLETNIHQYFNTPFFRDHDFATVENKITGQIFAVDPTVSDYLLIDFVTYTK